MIKNIIFDIGQVLVHFRYHEYMQDLGFSDELIQIFEEKIVLNDLWGQLDLGIRPEEEIIKEMYTRIPEYKKEADLFFGNLINIVSTYDYTVSWIKELKAKGYKVYLLSNYPKSLFELHDKHKFGFTDLVDGKIVSAFVKLSKPDERIYKCILDTYSLNADECIFFDDRQENVDAANKAGINAFLFQGKEQADKIIDMKGTGEI